MTLRLAADLHDALKRIAKEEDRSLHSLIIHVLRQFADRWKQQREG